MASMFKSKRLLISPVQDCKNLCDNNIIELLSCKVTAHLPPSWQNINTSNQSKTWLHERQNEGQVYALLLKGGHTDTFIGLLFLHKVSTSQQSYEVRLGYIISEDFWRRGLASELIASVIEAYKLDIAAQALIGGVSCENSASAKVLTKNGFVYYESANSTDFYRYKIPHN